MSWSDIGPGYQDYRVWIGLDSKVDWTRYSSLVYGGFQSRESLLTPSKYPTPCTPMLQLGQNMRSRRAYRRFTSAVRSRLLHPAQALTVQ